MGSCQSQCNSLANNQLVEEELSNGKQYTVAKDGNHSDSIGESERRKQNKQNQASQNGTNSSTQQQSTQPSSLTQINGKQGNSSSKNNTSQNKKQPQYEGSSGGVNENKQENEYTSRQDSDSGLKGTDIIWNQIRQRGCINIFYGTTSGTANELANQLANLLEQQSFYVRVIHIETFEPSMLRNCNLVVFFLSSYGTQGGPTDDAQQFYLWLNNFDNQGKPLISLEYSIFGLYNSKIKRLTVLNNQNDTEVESTNNIEVNSQINYKNEQEDFGSNMMNNSQRFIQAMNKKQVKIKSMGQRIDILLNEVGAKRFSSLIQVDSSKLDLLKESFKSFSEGILHELKEKYELTDQPEDIAYNKALQHNLKIQTCSSEKYPKGANNKRELEQIFSVKAVKSKSQYSLKDQLWDYFSSTDVPVLKMQYLGCDGMKDTITVHSGTQQSQSNLIAHAPRSQGMNLKLFSQQHQYLLIDLDVSKLPSQIGKPKFETGGILSLYPQNDDGSIKKLCDFLCLNENALITLSCKDAGQNPANCLISDFKYPIPFPITIRQYFKEFLDIHGPLNRNQVYELAQFANEQVEKDTLINLCKFSERERFDKEIIEMDQHSLLSLIIAYNIKVPFHILFGLGNLIKPRSFVISSSFLQNPNIIQLTVRIHIRNMLKMGDEITENYQQQSSKRIQKYCDGIEDEVSNNQKSTRNTSTSKPSTMQNAVIDGKSLGLTTQYFLETFQEFQKQNPQEIRVKCTSNHFQLPLNDIDVRIILICIDEGIALFRSYLQEIQQVNNVHNHEIFLYYGSKLLSNNEYLYQNELQEFEKVGTLKKLEVALTSSNAAGDTSCRDKIAQNAGCTIQAETSNSFSHLCAKNNSSSIQFLLENQIEHFSKLIEGIDKSDSNIRIYISGTQLMSQGIISAIAKAYSHSTKQSQYQAFSTVLNFENDGKIVRIIWES